MWTVNYNLTKGGKKLLKVNVCVCVSAKGAEMLGLGISPL